jgi:uncharacterized membrane protein
MPDSADPLRTAPSSGAHGDTASGLPANVAAALACIPLIGGIIFYVIEKQNKFVRFYAMQSIIFGGMWFIFWLVFQIIHGVLTPIPAIGLIFATLLWSIWAVAAILFVVVFIITVVKAFTGVRWEIPFLGPMAAKQANA